MVHMHWRTATTHTTAGFKLHTSHHNNEVLRNDMKVWCNTFLHCCARITSRINSWTQASHLGHRKVETNPCGGGRALQHYTPSPPSFGYMEHKQNPNSWTGRIPLVVFFIWHLLSVPHVKWFSVQNSVLISTCSVCQDSWLKRCLVLCMRLATSWYLTCDGSAESQSSFYRVHPHLMFVKWSSLWLTSRGWQWSRRLMFDTGDGWQPTDQPYRRYNMSYTNINWQNLEYNINFCTECGGDVEGKPQHAETNIRVAHSTGHICP